MSLSHIRPTKNFLYSPKLCATNYTRQQGKFFYDTYLHRSGWQWLHWVPQNSLAFPRRKTRKPSFITEHTDPISLSSGSPCHTFWMIYVATPEETKRVTKDIFRRSKTSVLRSSLLRRMKYNFQYLHCDTSRYMLYIFTNFFFNSDDLDSSSIKLNNKTKIVQKNGSLSIWYWMKVTLGLARKCLEILFVSKLPLVT